jgi:hypothetical protein
MSLLTGNKLGTLAQDRERSLRQQIVERYENVGLETDSNGKIIQEGMNWLHGLKGHVKDNMALLYENQARALVESTDSSSSGSFETVAFPMVRRIFSKLLANDIISVQAMTHPSGVLFYYYPDIANRVEGVDGDGNPTSSHTSQTRSMPACVLEGHNCPDTTYTGCKSLYTKFYDDNTYDYSKGKFTVVTATGQPVALDTNGCWVTTGTTALGYDGSLRHMKFGISGFDGSNPGTSKGHTARLGGVGGKGLEIDNQEFLASFTAIWANANPLLDPNGNVLYTQGQSMHYRAVSQKYAQQLVHYSDWCDADGVFYLEVDFTGPNANCDTCSPADGYIGAASGTTIAPTDIAFVWRRYEDLEWENEMGEVTFTIKKVQISTQPRKLRARWSPELAQDVNAYHNIDAEAELTALLSEQIAMEIDRQILRELKRGAAWVLRWNFYGWKTQGSQKYTEKEWKQTLITRINQISAQIHKSTLRGGANFLVISTEVSAIFDDLENFMVSNGNIDDDKYNLGMRRVGTLSGRYTVYVDPYAKAGDILIGHKGTSILDTGYIYAPYIPLQLTPTLTDFNTFTNVKGVMTRYATAMVNNNYYGRIVVDNIPTFDTRELR